MKTNLLTALLLLGFSSAYTQSVILHCGSLIDGISDAPRKNVSVIITGNRISDVKDGFVNGAAQDKVIDLRRQTVTPGWMDMHVHLESETNKNAYTEKFTLNPADYAFQSAVFAERTLMAGFTTVRDLGGSGVNISLRNAINKGLVKGPRVFTAGKSIATTGGHADPTNGYRRELMGDPGPEAGVVNGPDDCRKAVRQAYKYGSDLIKITATGGVLSVAKDGSSPQFTEEELKAIVETARDYNMRVAAHAHGAEGIKRAIRAGVHSIEHGTLMDDEAMALAKQYGTWYVPTIIAGRSTADSAKIPGYYPALVQPKALTIGPKLQGTFARAYKAGVKIAFGTDAGVFMHGRNWLEFSYMVEGGMPAMETIKAATIHAADLLGMKDQLGSITPGKLADIVAVDGDPLQDIQSMGKVCFVMKDGLIFKHTTPNLAAAKTE
ncbi:metal-dependent hydrolase family protein [Chitinophaga japonensis]|uniref:Imidazolonepropionase-like amidohydrolase n=1 Tax=Chitinophaga japonensis TaxID=104662 RepID=A0A562TE60_CHIJA|nr:amidohydrolase family protein [Chitinophaga japonensis]TWI91802.1 imidazolonepropionase-like amidohydrolase [Chitinophaga japonensis]